jgi:transcriptional regulator with XRE-family HTH domain
MIYFGNNVRALRLAKGWSQEKLASLLNVKANTVSNYETGTSYPDFNSFVSIIKLFEVNADAMIFKDLSKDSKVSQEQRSTEGTMSASDKKVYEDRLAEKDKTIEALQESIALYRTIMNSKKQS